MNLEALDNAQNKPKFEAPKNTNFMELDIIYVIPNPNQPRKQFNETELEELAESIKDKGLIQPIAVVKSNMTYMIVSGERRYRASKLAGLSTIKAHILSVNEKDIKELALIENIQRADLTDFETAKYITELLATGSYSKKQDLADAIGKSASYISKAIGCMKLSQEITADLEANERDIGLSVLEEIARVKDKKIQKEVYDLIVKKEITRDEIKNFKDLDGWDEEKLIKQKKHKSVEKVEIREGLGGLLFNDNSMSEWVNKNFELNKKYKIIVEEL